MDRSHLDSREQNDPLLGQEAFDAKSGFDHPDSIFKKHPYTSSGLLSRIFFSWPFKVLQFGKKNHLKPENLGEVYPNFSSEMQNKRLSDNWEKYKHSKKMPLLKAILATYKKEFMVAFLLNLIVV